MTVQERWRRCNKTPPHTPDHGCRSILAPDGPQWLVRVSSKERYGWAVHDAAFAPRDLWREAGPDEPTEVFVSAPWGARRVVRVDLAKAGQRLAKAMFAASEGFVLGKWEELDPRERDARFDEADDLLIDALFGGDE